MSSHANNYTNLYHGVNTNSCLTSINSSLHNQPMDFRTWLRQEMDERNLTEKQVEEITIKIGEYVPQATINRILNNVTPNPRQKTVAALMRAFDVDPASLLTQKLSSAERRLSAVAAVAFSEEEKLLLDGFRLADASTRRHMLRMAEDSLINFGKRSGENNH